MPPSGNERILLGVAALLPDPAFSKRKLMLSVYQGRRTSGVKLVDATRPQNAILEDFLILAWADGAPDFGRQLFSDNAPFPEAAVPERDKDDHNEWQESGELNDAPGNEGLQEPDIEDRVALGFTSERLALGRCGQCPQQGQRVVQQVRCDCSNWVEAFRRGLF